MKIDRTTRAVVTGAGSGLGKAFAKELAARGAVVVVSDVRLDTARKTADEIVASGGEAHALACDVTRGEDVVRLADESATQIGDVDLVINNAGIGAAGEVGAASLESWRQVIDVNLFGVIHGCHAFVPAMRARKRGHVVNVASMAGIAQLPGMGPYNVTKAAVVALSETLAAETMRDGVGVTVLCPSFFPTNILKDSVGVVDPEKTKVAEKLMHRSKWTAEDIARMTLDAAERGKLYVLPHVEGRWIWRLKRLAPVAYANLVGRYDLGGGGLTRRQ